MESFNDFSVRFDSEKCLLEVLDQRKLPAEEDWLETRHCEEMRERIATLSVRGAPMIGCAAAVQLALCGGRCGGAEDGDHAKAVFKAHAALLRAARPTAVNLMHCVDRMVEEMEQSEDGEWAKRLIQVATELRLVERERCSLMAKFGVSLIADGTSETVMHICNTGSLAVPGVGTALGVVREGYRQGKIKHCYVLETRPLLQGGRLTAYELTRDGIPHTIVCDSAAGMLMQQGKIDRVLAGADRIAANGDTANKIGTYSLFVLAHFHSVPTTIVAPSSSIDPLCPSASHILIEERSPDEVRGFRSLQWSPPSPVYNPAFDVSPARLIGAYVFERGVVRGGLGVMEVIEQLRGESQD